MEKRERRSATQCSVVLASVPTERAIRHELAPEPSSPVDMTIAQLACIDVYF